MYTDFGVHVDSLVLLDANAARGIIERKGLCKVRHLDTDHLWLQQQQARRLLPIQKVDGTTNIADLMTKHLNEANVGKYMTMLGCEFRDGRADTSLHLTK